MRAVNIEQKKNLTCPDDETAGVHQGIPVENS